MILRNKNILVTGAGKGIGESCVYSIISNGGFVFALIKDKRDNKKFKDLRNIFIFNGNVNNKKLIENFEDIQKVNKPINCVVNNAGVRFRKSFLNIKKDDLSNVFDVNFFSILNIMCKFLQNL